MPGQPIGRGRLAGIALECGFDQIEALVESVAAVEHVGLRFTGCDHRIARPHHIAPADVEWVHADRAREFVDCRFDRENGLRQPIAAKRAGRYRVGVDRVTVDFLVGATVNGDRFPAGMFEHSTGVISVGTCIRKHMQLHCGERAVVLGAELDVNAHGMARAGGSELLLTGEFQLDRAAEAQRRQRDNVLDKHFLLGAKAAADPLAKHAHFVEIETEDTRQLLAREERHLRAGAHIELAVGIEPGDGGMGLEMGVLDTRGDVSAFMHDVGRGKSRRDIANIAVDLRNDVVGRIGDARGGILGVNDRRARTHGFFRIKDRGQVLVVHHHAAAAFLGGRLAVGHHRGDALADEAHDVVQHFRVVGVDRADFRDGRLRMLSAANPRTSTPHARPAP